MKDKTTKKRRTPRWFALDNAAKIYPAAKSREWSNVFRLSATMKDEIDTDILRQAVANTAPRFPSIAARLRRGVFWFYLKELDTPPEILEEQPYPLLRMSNKEMCRCAIRVLVYGKRIAVELFHSLTDGTGGLTFLKTLLAEYVTLRYGVEVPPECGILIRDEEPRPEELRDDFLRFAGEVKASRKESDAYRVRGTREFGGFLNLTTFKMKADELKKASHGYGVTVTTMLTAALLRALLLLEEEEIPNKKRRKSAKVLVPVNLRPLFGSSSLRNFAMYTIPEADPRLGDFTLEELCRLVHHKLGLEVTAKNMSRMIATNVESERMLLLRVTPLFLKNVVMKAIFNAVGERKSCLSFSNLGVVKLPPEMEEHIDRFDFVLGVQATAPYNCGLITFGDTAYMNFIRDIKEPRLEYAFYSVLREIGITPTVESNRPRELKEIK